MKKTLIALAVGSAFAAPTAFADVTLSGSINAGPAYVRSGDGSVGVANAVAATGATAQTGTSASAINTNYSNITIGSLEDDGQFQYHQQRGDQPQQPHWDRERQLGRRVVRHE
jgi:hypothetical protein